MKKRSATSPWLGRARLCPLSGAPQYTGMSFGAPSHDDGGLRRRVGLWLGPALLLLTLLVPSPTGLETPGWRTAGVGLRLVFGVEFGAVPGWAG